ncbi:MAG: ferric reductase-like transmembrane domain-containing protein [Blastocatellia bacterium]|nr:ferric reductase-like transmembrane domain-containing protein [Blastocatellia bacterium]
MAGKGFFRGWIITGWAALAVVLMIAVIFLAQGFGEEGMRTVTRATARTSISLFLIAFTASPLLAVWPNDLTRWLRANRRYIGVSFALSHAFHAAAIYGLARLTSGESLPGPASPEFLGGALGYIFIAAMAATSFDRTARWLGAKRWRILHTSGMYYLWMVFMFSYGGRATQSIYYVPLAVLLISAMVLRLFAHKRPKRMVAVKQA